MPDCPDLKKRLPPGQLITERFPVLHYGSVPIANLDTWTFMVWGAVEEPISLSWEQFSSLPSTSVKMDLHCVTRWSKLDTLWEGVHLRTLIESGLIKPLTGAKYVLQHAEQGFTANLPLELMLQDNFLLATHYNHEPLKPEHGFPLRAVCGAIPGRSDLKDVYLWKGAKWLRGLEFSYADRPGFWEKAGYHNAGDVWQEERYA